MTEAQWKQVLTPEQFRVLREKGTERAFTGALYKNEEEGTYHCAACGALLFSSDTKYESGSGWPSFYQAVSNAAVDTERDESLWMVRTEIQCAKCGSHLGHVFDDGPRPTGKRYCVNSMSLQFQPSDSE